jgi:hypothetical protein
MTERSGVPKRHRDPGVQQTPQNAQDSCRRDNITYLKEKEYARSEISTSATGYKKSPLKRWIEPQDSLFQKQQNTKQQQITPKQEDKQEEGKCSNITGDAHSSSTTTTTAGKQTDDDQTKRLSSTLEGEALVEEFQQYMKRTMNKIMDELFNETKENSENNEEEEQSPIEDHRFDQHKFDQHKEQDNEEQYMKYLREK